MKKKTKKIIYWTPRILIILFAIFISLFALDIFSEGYTGMELLIAGFMHLIPTFIIIILLAIAWKWEKIGGWLLIALAVIFFFWFDGYKHITTFLAINLPVLIIGILFLISEKVNKKKR